MLEFIFGFAKRVVTRPGLGLDCRLRRRLRRNVAGRRRRVDLRELGVLGESCTDGHTPRRDQEGTAKEQSGECHTGNFVFPTRKQKTRTISPRWK